MEDLLWLSARAQRDLLVHGDVSAVELMNAHYDQIEAHNGRVNALVNVLPRDQAVTLAAEADAARHIKQTRALVDHARKLGIGFAIQHYGIDQERFQILDLLKPDYIKIDGELMHTLMTDENVQEAVAKIVDAAREREIRTVAERVENANSMAVLFQLGLDYMQGHYVHEPEVVLQERKVKATTLAGLVSANTA